MSYESEDRYWTDYLRVALPVIGLLLMLALFWWWAQQFIGDNGDPDDVALSTQTTIVTQPPPTPTVTAAVNLASTPGQDTTETPVEGQSGNGNEGEGTNVEGNGQNCGFSPGDSVQVTEDGVRLREEPTVEGTIILESIPQEDVWIILSECYQEDAEGNEYWEVSNEATSQDGFVTGEFLTLVGDEE